MSLYYHAAPFLLSPQGQPGSLKSRIFNAKDIRSSPKQVYALVAEASKWSPILSEVIERSQLLQHERKLAPDIALLLVHDLLLSKSGIAAPATHPLRVAVTRHKARLSAELTKVRIKKGLGSIDELRSCLARAEGPQTLLKTPGGPNSEPYDEKWQHPRWVRVNTVKTTLEDQLATTFADYEKALILKEVLRARPERKILYVDEHVPNLVALPVGADLTRAAAYRNGLIILQDKASCFPAFLLNPHPEHGACLDACAAPGNKTTHLSAIIQSRCKDHCKARILACEKDKARAETLTKMVSLAGCDELVTVKAGQDFLLLDPEKAPWKDLGSVLLDPSCSGSGIVGRDQMVPVTLPTKGGKVPEKNSRKRKRVRKPDTNPTSTETLHEDHPEGEEPFGAEEKDEQLYIRLKALSAFQLRLLLHAFRFPSAQRISYSTCSIHTEENEHVVIEALKSTSAIGKGWRLLRRNEQIAGMKSWPVRGHLDACHGVTEGAPASAEEIAEACIRCQRGTEEGTQGFFVAAFIRDPRTSSKGNCRSDGHQGGSSGANGWVPDPLDRDVVDSSEDWQGLSDAE
ncbi:MAG: hypothetical protein LQ338_002170 [Usnochroma carphineum]|nr:MAG: hypothetical protein LQ338_002170 [Usnochroma carphineum]